MSDNIYRDVVLQIQQVVNPACPDLRIFCARKNFLHKWQWFETKTKKDYDHWLKHHTRWRHRFIIEHPRCVFLPWQVRLWKAPCVTYTSALHQRAINSPSKEIKTNE